MGAIDLITGCVPTHTAYHQSNLIFYPLQFQPFIAFIVCESKNCLCIHSHGHKPSSSLLAVRKPASTVAIIIDCCYNHFDSRCFSRRNPSGLPLLLSGRATAAFVQLKLTRDLGRPPLQFACFSLQLLPFHISITWVAWTGTQIAPPEQQHHECIKNNSPEDRLRTKQVKLH